jgi:hypothetical protein
MAKVIAMEATDMEFNFFGYYEKIAGEFERMSKSLRAEGKPGLADALVELASQIRLDCEPKHS